MSAANLVRAYVEQHSLARKRGRDGREGDEEWVGDGGSRCTIAEVEWFDKVHHGQLMLKEKYVRAISRSVLAAI